MEQFFPFGTQYHRAPTPLEGEWDGDMEEIAARGYTHVQLRPQWRCHERIRGQYDFSELDRLFAVAQSKGLRVIVKPQLENAPDWVFTELSGTRIGFNGQPLSPIAHAAFYVGGWWPCFDVPAVAEAAEKFTESLARHVSGQKALWFFNAWNEPRSRPLGQCCCRHSLQSYRDYLRGKFGTIEALNGKYGKAWTSFDTIFPPHSHSDYVELFLWRQWAGHSVAHQVRLSASGLRRGAPGVPVMCHVGQSSIVQDPACDTSNDLLNAREVDWYGCSFPVELLPRCGLERHQPHFLSAWMRRVDPGYWCQEFYTNYSCFHPEADPEYVEQCLWVALAAGCRGLTFWQYRSERLGEESNGWGMREMDGSPTPRSRRCDCVAGQLREWGAALAETNPVPARAAVLFDRENDLLMRIEAMHGALSGIAAITEDCNYSYKKYLRGAAYLLRCGGYASDFVIPGGEDYSGYSLICAGAWEMVPEAAVPALERFVADGGTLLIEYPFACRDDRTWMALRRPASGLEKLTGCTEKHRTDFQSPDDTAKIIYADGVIDNAAFCQVELAPLAGEVIARWEDGTPAVVRNRFGRGQVFTAGSNLAFGAAHRGEADSLPHLYTLAMAASGLPPKDGRVWDLERSSKSHRFRFLFHPFDGEADRAIPEGFELLYASPRAKAEGRRLILGAQSTAILHRKQD